MVAPAIPSNRAAVKCGDPLPQWLPKHYWQIMTLEIQDLTCLRGERPVVQGLSASVPAGGALVLTGPNGAGKTTLLRALAGLIPPARGRISLAGLAARDEPGWADHLIWLGHLDAVKGQLSFAANLAAWARIYGQDPAAVRPALEFFGIAHLAAGEARHASAGQRRRLALARLMLVRRKLWLLDEPATALDQSGIAALAEAVAAHRADQGIVVLSTHQDLGLPGAVTVALGAAP
jgi:heme exporter protein A